MISIHQPAGKNAVNILTVDDSLVFRRFLREACGLPTRPGELALVEPIHRRHQGARMDSAQI